MSNLKNDLEQVTKFAKENMPPVFFENNDKMLKDLTEKEVALHCLKEGDMIPTFRLPDMKGKIKSFSDLIEGKNWLIISFNRGEWCPYCNLELRYLQEKMQEFEKIPAHIVSISNRTFDKMAPVLEKNKITFDVLTDEHFHLAKQFNLVFHVPPYLTETYKKFGVDENYLNENGNMEMVVPATYLIDKKGVVRMYFAEVNFANRLDPELILDYIRKNN
jgi:peroxiredoxin